MVASAISPTTRSVSYHELSMPAAEVVQNNAGDPMFAQFFDRVGSNVAGAPRDKDSHE